MLLMIMRKYFFLVSSIIVSNSLFAQESIHKRITSVHLDFQKNADTTFIIQKIDKLLPKPNYFILSKKDKQINIYYYGDATNRIRVPSGIISAMNRVNFGGDKTRKFDKVLFYPLAITKEDALAFWQKVMNSKPWNISDDVKNQECSDPSIRVYDGEHIGLFLITKKEIRPLVFYDPNFYEEKCPGNPHREAFLKIQDTFKFYFKF